MSVEKEFRRHAIARHCLERQLCASGEVAQAWALAANEATREVRPWFSVDRAGSSAIVRIGNDIGTGGATAEMLLASVDGCDKVELQIDSRGGCGNTSLALYRGLKVRVDTCTIKNFCASGAVIIAMAAKTIRIESNARMMLHQPRAFVFENAHGLHEAAHRLADTSEAMKAILQETTMQLHSVIDGWFCSGRDFYFTAQEAVDAGLADEIFTAPELSPLDPKFYGDAPTDEAELFRLLNTFPCVRVKDRARFMRNVNARLTCKVTEV